jgi:hypothetical protein
MRILCILFSLLAATVLFPLSAHAQYNLAGRATGGGGVYVSFTFGQELGVGYGLEGHFDVFARGDCLSSKAPAGAGGLFQVGGINGSTLRLMGAARGGSVLGPGALLGELGLTGHIGESRGIGLHTGIDYNAYVIDTFFRQEWLLAEYSVGVGGGFPPPLYYACSISD